MKKIAIVGLGLMGGSLAARIREAYPDVKVIGVSRSREAVRTAKAKRWAHTAGSDLSLAREADFIVLSTPVDTLTVFLSKLDKIAKSGTIVTDQGSVKGEIASWAGKRKFKNIRFVGAHPMAGAQTQGIRFATPDLFKNSLVFITPSKNSPKAAVSAVTAFWKRIAGRALVIGAREHDKITAQISHLPHATATCLVLAASGSNLKFGARGFRDATRVAEGDPAVWLPIFLSNRGEVLKSLDAFSRRLRDFAQALRRKDARRLTGLLAHAARLRKGLGQG